MGIPPWVETEEIVESFEECCIAIISPSYSHGYYLIY
jgi:hypothetical protein